MSMAYLDNSATTPVLKQAADKAYDIMTNNFGNPSSLHKIGIDAEQELRNARSLVAASLRCEDDEIFFTSGGTESNNIAIFGAAEALKRRGNRIVTSTVEHPSVLNMVKHLEMCGFEAVYLKPVDGIIPIPALEEAINKDTILVTMMAVNNETGMMLPVEAIKRIILRVNAPAFFHVDAVQAYGKLPIYPQTIGADLLTVSGHKVHAPKGTGALYIKKGIRIIPLTYGGGQEKGVRSGTENMAGIAAFGVAAKFASENLRSHMQHITELRQYLEEQITEKVDGIIINSPKTGAAHILNISIPGMKSETMLHFLESKGVFVSAGSACGAKKHSISPVLTALGLPRPIAESALRISMSYLNKKEDIDLLTESLIECKKSIVNS